MKMTFWPEIRDSEWLGFSSDASGMKFWYRIFKGHIRGNRYVGLPVGLFLLAQEVNGSSQHQSGIEYRILT
jgi:hypothetical protein